MKLSTTCTTLTGGWALCSNTVMSRSIFWMPIVLVATTFASCGPRIIGHAVVLWPAGGTTVEHGAVVPVIARSDVQNQLVLWDGDIEHRFDSWRVEFFRDDDDAVAFAGRFAPWRTVYGQAARTALPVRERPDRSTATVYRLRNGEIIKIITRADEPSDEAGLVDYWYQVLTSEGVGGWVFGFHLELVSASGRALQPDEEADRAERLLTDISAVLWRPDYFVEMIETSRVDLTRFGTQFGLFADLEAATFTIVLPEVQRRFAYRKARLASSNRLEFQGTELVLIARASDLVAQYSVAGQEYSTIFVPIEQSVTDIVAAERERRRQALQAITRGGARLISTTFGTIQIGANGALSWSSFDRLVPDVLPSDFTGVAGIRMDQFLSNPLVGRYSGAFRMDIGATESLVFLYTIVDDGLRLVYTPARLTRSNIVLEEPVSSVIMFFRYADG